MKFGFWIALALAPAASSAIAQASTAPATAGATAPAATPLNGDTPIETIAADAAGKAALNKVFPEVLTHPGYEQFKGMSLRQLAPLSGGIITDEKVAALEAQLKVKN